MKSSWSVSNIEHKGALVDPIFKNGKALILSRSEPKFLDKLRGANMNLRMQKIDKFLEDINQITVNLESA